MQKGAVLLSVGGLCLVILALTWTARAPIELEDLNEDAATLPETGEVVDRPHETTEMVYAEQHPVYTRCARRVDMPEFVKLIRKTCGNIHELQSLAHTCTDVLEQSAKHFGCCWETVMNAYKQLDPQAHHSWRMWQGTLSGKSGVVFEENSCGDAMGEHDYRHLENQVAELKDTVEDQQSELELVEHILMMAMGYSNAGKTSDLNQLEQVGGMDARGVTHAPFSSGELEQALRQLDHGAGRQQMMARRVAQARHSINQARRMGDKGTYFFTDSPTGDEGVEKMQEAGVNV